MRYKDRIKAAIRDIKGKEFISGTYSICNVVYAAERLLWLCDKSEPMMAKLERGTGAPARPCRERTISCWTMLCFPQ